MAAGIVQNRADVGPSHEEAVGPQENTGMFGGLMSALMGRKRNADPTGAAIGSTPNPNVPGSVIGNMMGGAPQGRLMDSRMSKGMKPLAMPKLEGRQPSDNWSEYA